MEFKILKKGEETMFFEQIFEMMEQSDKDFVPPLSARSSTTQKNLICADCTGNGIKSYFEEMKKQRFMVCTDGDVLAAFVSFKENFTNDKISEAELPNIYISTLIMRPEYRGNGITQTMYSKLFDTYKSSNVFTRTWSTNSAHIKILSKFGFTEIAVINDDRGKGIDTVYYRKGRC